MQVRHTQVVCVVGLIAAFVPLWLPYVRQFVKAASPVRQPMRLHTSTRITLVSAHRQRAEKSQHTPTCRLNVTEQLMRIN